jgi:mRNA interferase RelE/StbE
MKPVVYLKSAAKELMKLNAAERERVGAKIKQYAAEPETLANQIKTLKGVAALRLRVGDYRMIFRNEPDRIVILKLGHRRDVYD